MLTLANLKRAASAVGAVVEDDSDGRRKAYQVVAPAGKLWHDGAKCIPVWWYPGDAGHRDEAIRDGVAQIGAGLIDGDADEA